MHWLGYVIIILAFAIGACVVLRCRKPDIHGDYP